MKNKDSQAIYSWTQYSQEGTKPPVINTGSGSYSRELVISSTNNSQNLGDHVSGTPFGYEVMKKLPFVGSYNYKVSGTNLTVGGSGAMTTISPVVAVSPSQETNVDNESIVSALERMRGGIDLSVDAFQIMQTVRMIKRPVQTFTKLYEQFREKKLLEYASRKWKRRPPFHKFLSDSWLEYIYGWMPLLQTTYEIAGQMGNIAKPGPTMQVFKGSSQITETRSKDEIRSFAGTTHKVSVTHSTFYGSRIYLLMKMSDAKKAQHVSTYTSLDPTSIAWELVPFSFVVDWFYDIGSYLRSCETALMYSSLFHSGWKSTIRVTNTQAVGLPRNFSGAVGSLSGSGSAQLISFGRARFSNIPSPSKPVVQGATDLSWSQLTSALALLAQAFGKH